jgi:phosphate transport system ATP-binding protein
MVTHNMEQARRISDYTAFFYKGELAECGKTAKVFDDPDSELLRNYISGKF